MVSNSSKEITVLCGCLFNETTVLFLASKILVMADTARELSEGLKIKIPNKRSGQSKIKLHDTVITLFAD